MDNGKQLDSVEGTVKWFDPRKGFGFIHGPEGQDIFVHYTAIDGDGFRVLKDGSSVTYDAEHTTNGWKATRVVRHEPVEVVVVHRPAARPVHARSPRR